MCVAASWRRLHANLEETTARRAARFFHHFEQIITGRVARIGNVGFTVEELFHLSEFHDEFVQHMRPAWAGAAYAGIEFESEWIGSRQVSQQRAAMITQRDDSGPPPSFHVDLSPEMQRRIKGWMGEREAGVWKRVGTSVQERLRRAIRRGLVEGDSFDDIQDRIRSVLKKQTDYAARRIARTETTGSLNFGQQIERDDIGIEFKEWIATIDMSTRGADPKDAYNHLSADGQTVRNSELFTISGEKLSYPGDGSHGAGAGNLCNCRCAGASAFPEEPLKPVLAKPPVAPTAESESTALGTPVSKALAPIGTRKQIETVNEVLRIIDSVHGDGALTKIPVTWNRKLYEHGSYSSLSGVPKGITASSKGEYQLLTLAHEIGHFLDQQALGVAGRFASESADATIRQRMAAFTKAALNSPQIKQLRELLSQRQTDITVNGEVMRARVDHPHVRYLLSHREIFARAYSQWIAVRSGHPTLKKQLDMRRGKTASTAHDVLYTVHWPDEDFAPIKAALDELFQEMKWTK